MAGAALIGIDVGATSIKVGAFDETGELLALASRRNAPTPQDAERGWFVWDMDRIWGEVATSLREVTAALPPGTRPVAVAATGFGADGAPFGPDGVQRYPVISWHDARAAEDLDAILDAAGERRVYDLTGYHGYPINTLCRWRWLQRHQPEALRDATWLMVPDIVAHRLSGERRTDPTSASTTMAFDLAEGRWSSELLDASGVPSTLPAPLVEPGTAAGSVTAAAAAETGLPAGIPVVVGGHDAEVAALAAGALPDGTALDISGTWELVIRQHESFEPTDRFLEQGIDWERDAVRGSFLCVGLMPSGSILNWLRELAYPAEPDWRPLVRDARSAPIGAHGVTVVPAFVRGTGPFARRAGAGSFAGLQTTTTRADLARAVFEALCFQLRLTLRNVERLHGRPIDAIRVTGGAQHNSFWLQLKADTTGCVAHALPHEELTLLGAALLAGIGAGVYGSAAEAVEASSRPYRATEPDAATVAAYDELFASYASVAAELVA